MDEDKQSGDAPGVVCPGPTCAVHVLEMIVQWANSGTSSELAKRLVPEKGDRANRWIQGGLFTAEAYSEENPVLQTVAEFEGALDHIEYAVFRRFQNVLTRAERGRLDNTIDNALYKAQRFLERFQGERLPGWQSRLEAARGQVAGHRERTGRQQDQARRAEQRLAQLGSLTPEGFEEFVAELFESLGFKVEQVGGSGDEGADLRVSRDGLMGVVQCKYFSRGVIGSPELQKFLGTIHHMHCHKGFFVTTRTFTLAAEKFVADHPIELIDGPRLVELVHEALGPNSKSPPVAMLF